MTKANDICQILINWLSLLFQKCVICALPFINVVDQIAVKQNKKYKKVKKQKHMMIKRDTDCTQNQTRTNVTTIKFYPCKKQKNGSKKKTDRAHSKQPLYKPFDEFPTQKK